MAVTTLQPSDKDTHIRSFAPTTNYGTIANNTLSDQSIARNRLVLNFDASGVSGTVSPAILKLYYNGWGANDPNGLTVWTYKVVDTRDTWVENQITWNIWKTSNNWTTAGGDWEPTSPTPASITMPPSLGWIEFDITDIVQDAIDNVSGSVNILIKYATETEGGGYHISSFYSNNETTYDGDPEEDRRPMLEINIIDIVVTDTFTLSDTAKENLTQKSSDTLSLSENSKQNMGFTVKDAITITDKLLQLWRRLAKHVATYVHLSKSEASPTYTQKSKSTSIWSFLTKNR